MAKKETPSRYDSEASNAADEEFGEEGLRRVAREHVSESEFKVLQALRRALERHLDGRPAADDTTIVVQKIIDGISSAEDQQISIRA